jgi:hypothetical protein
VQTKNLVYPKIEDIGVNIDMKKTVVLLIAVSFSIVIGGYSEYAFATTSTADTVVNGTNGVIYDTSNVVWAINSNKQITMNGTIVASSSNVVTLFWTGTALDQLNAGGDWYTQPLTGVAGVSIATPAGYVTTSNSNGSTLTSNYEFLDSIGVNMHISQGTAQYDDLSDDENDLAYLGIHNARDSYNPFWEAYQHSYSILSNISGIKWDFLSVVGNDSSPPTETSSQISNFLANTVATDNAGGIGYIEAEVPGSVYAVEGPNEINNFAIDYNTGSTIDTGTQAGVDYQESLYSQAKADVSLTGVKVFYFTGYCCGDATGPNPSTTSGLADYDTQHPYPGSNNPPLNWVNPTTAFNNESAPFGPGVYTETGYNTNDGGITQAAMGAWILDILADDWYNNISKTYIYQLMSDSLPDGSGLFTNSNASTTSALDLHNFTTILNDLASNAASYTPISNVTYTITGNGVSSFALQKASGETDIIVWNETSSYPGTQSTATVTFGNQVMSANVFDPTIGTTTIAAHSNVSNVSLNLIGAPQIIEVTASPGNSPPVTILPCSGQ